MSWKTNGTQIFKFDESKGEEFQDREIIANIYTPHQDNKEQREKTARLIASAPELLESLKWMVSVLDCDGNIDSVTHEGMIEDVRNIINKVN
ncbi:MAG TPA: hypothetical protein VIY47_01455 [Ignavibacteriaceae bacterium]